MLVYVDALKVYLKISLYDMGAMQRVLMPSYRNIYQFHNTTSVHNISRLSMQKGNILARVPRTMKILCLVEVLQTLVRRLRLAMNTMRNDGSIHIIYT